MAGERKIYSSIGVVRAELKRLIAYETSSFRARLFEQELARLQTCARDYGRRPTRFSRKGLSEVFETVATYTVESLECWPEGDGIIRLNTAETMRRLNHILAALRELSK